jgi:hypothetical protein
LDFGCSPSTARLSESVLGPGNEDYIRIRPQHYTQLDHGGDIVVAMTNVGSTHYMVQPSDCIAQILLMGVGDVERVKEHCVSPCMITRHNDEPARHNDEPLDTFAAPVVATPKSSIKKPWSAEWKAGGPETTSK